jgi:outer membrane protein assembly factor BamB
MICFTHARVLLLAVAAMLLIDAGRLNGQSRDFPPAQTNTTVHLRWGQRAGVSRYRLQLAQDSSFRDIVFDRIVDGNEIDIDDLTPGRYFWRIASLTTKLGEFSSGGIIEVSPPREPLVPRINDQTKPQTVPANSIVAGGGWRAAVGDISHPVLAHLRAPDKFDIVGTNSDGVTFALDAISGVAFWSFRARGQVAARGAAANAPLIVSSRARLDNVVVFAGTMIIEIEGLTGRELWRANLPAAILSGTAISDQRSSRLAFIDTSLQRLIIIDSFGGNILAQIALPARVVGPPVAFGDQSNPGFLIAYDNGRIESRDRAGALLRAGDTGSSATTAPIFVRGARGNLILIGTRDGLTAMTADSLRPLGRVTIKDDVPRGTLMAQDIDGDGIAEAIMTTARGHVVTINATDGRIVWDVAADNDSDSFAFADVNGDHVLDIFISTGQTFAIVLSGRDGSTIWKDAGSHPLIANHAMGLVSRTIVLVPYGAGAILIASEPSHAGLRAIAFAKAEIRPSPR